MTSTRLLTRAIAGVAAAALALAACGTGSATVAPSAASPAGPTQAVATQVPATVAVTPAPATAVPVTPAPATEPPATEEPVEDPAAAVDIGGPYEMSSLDPELADAFAVIMTEALGSMADDVAVGFRTVEERGTIVGVVLVMHLEGIPMNKAFLDAAAIGAAQGGKLEKRTIAGVPVRVVDANGRAVFLTFLDEDLVMVIGMTKGDTADLTEALIKAN